MRPWRQGPTSAIDEQLEKARVMAARQAAESFDPIGRQSPRRDR